MNGKAIHLYNPTNKMLVGYDENLALSHPELIPLTKDEGLRVAKGEPISAILSAREGGPRPVLPAQAPAPKAKTISITATITPANKGSEAPAPAEAAAPKGEGEKPNGDQGGQDGGTAAEPEKKPGEGEGAGEGTGDGAGAPAAAGQDGGEKPNGDQPNEPGTDVHLHVPANTVQRVAQLKEKEGAPNDLGEVKRQFENLDRANVTLKDFEDVQDHELQTFAKNVLGIDYEMSPDGMTDDAKVKWVQFVRADITKKIKKVVQKRNERRAAGK